MLTHGSVGVAIAIHVFVTACILKLPYGMLPKPERRDLVRRDL